jgi:hypothetical protein
MAGNSSIRGDETITFTDNMSFDGTDRGGKMTTDGQLWIGATASNRANNGGHVRLGSLTSPNGTITIGYSAPNITLELAGGTTAIDSIAVDTTTGAGTNPVVPTVAGLVTFTGGQYATGTFGTRVITINSPAANTVDVEVQISTASASSLITNNGVAHFDSTSFAVDANGFVTMAGGGGFTWTDTSGTFTAAKNNGYFITGTSTANLPASPSQGDTIKFFVDHASQVLTIDAPGTQLIRMGSIVTSAGGTAVSTAQGDSVELTYRASDTCWCAIAGFTGNWTLT